MLLSSSTYQLGLICITKKYTYIYCHILLKNKAYFGKNIIFLLVMKIRPNKCYSCCYINLVQFVFNEWLSLTSFSEDNFS